MAKRPIRPDGQQGSESNEAPVKQAGAEKWPRLVTQPRIVNDKLLAQLRDVEGTSSGPPPVPSVNTPTRGSGQAVPAHGSSTDYAAAVIEEGVLPETHALLSGIQADRDVEACAKAFEDGSPEHVAGHMDADTACAVVAMASGNLAEVGAMLGIGDVRSWSIGRASSSWYIHLMDDGFIVAIGKLQKSTLMTLHRLFSKLKA